jgi:hypothetical protein
VTRITPAGDVSRPAGRLTTSDPVERTVLADGRLLAVTPSRLVAADAGSWQQTGAARLAG